MIAIISILASIAIPSYFSYVKKAKETVCNANCMQIERMYEAHLKLENIEHTDLVFEQFLQEYCQNVCPEHGDITYVDGKIKCSVHTREDDSKNDDGDVPFLD